METVKLKDLCILKHYEKDENGITYCQYDLAITEILRYDMFNFKILTGKQSGKTYCNIKSNFNGIGSLMPCKFDNYESVGCIWLGLFKIYLQQLIKGAIVKEEKYFESNNDYSVDKIKTIMKQFNNKLYKKALKEFQSYTNEM